MLKILFLLSFINFASADLKIHPSFLQSFGSKHYVANYQNKQDCILHGNEYLSDICLIEVQNTVDISKAGNSIQVSIDIYSDFNKSCNIQSDQFKLNSKYSLELKIPNPNYQAKNWVQVSDDSFCQMFIDLKNKKSITFYSLNPNACEFLCDNQNLITHFEASAL